MVSNKLNPDYKPKKKNAYTHTISTYLIYEYV